MDDMKKAAESAASMDFFGAGNRTRTGDIDLGKVALYQLSYARICCWRRVRIARGAVK